MSRSRAELLVDQARTYRQVDNPTWFRLQAASYRAQGKHLIAEEMLQIAREHHIEIPCGEQLVPAINMRVRQAS